MIEKFLNPFMLSFLLSVALTLFFIWLSGKLEFRRKFEKRHIHPRHVFRLGGPAIILSFVAAILINPDLKISSELLGIIVASLVIMIVGIIDDLRELYWKAQLFFQIAISVLVFIMGVEIAFITNPFGGIIEFDGGIMVILGVAILVFWIVALVNALNWLDGIDGLSGGVTFIGALTLFSLSLAPEVNQPPLAIICMALAGSVLGFLVFNFNPAKILAGTSGSMFMGFSIAVIAVFAGAKIATALLTMAIPIIDSAWVVAERIKNKQSIFKPDNRHLHYKLIQLGWSQRKVTFYYYSITILIAFAALNTRTIGKFVTMIIVFVIVIGAIFIVNQKIASLENKT